MIFKGDKYKDRPYEVKWTTVTEDYLADLKEEARWAFIESHERSYWSDSNPRPPQGHNKKFEDCQDHDCEFRRNLLSGSNK